jgi:hypothetical protein
VLKSNANASHSGNATFGFCSLFAFEIFGSKKNLFKFRVVFETFAILIKFVQISGWFLNFCVQKTPKQSLFVYLFCAAIFFAIFGYFSKLNCPDRPFGKNQIPCFLPFDFLLCKRRCRLSDNLCA